MDKVPNDKILQMCNTSCTCASVIVRYRRLRWLGHVARMGNDRLPKIMMFRTLEGAGKRGRPIRSWNDCVRKKKKNARPGNPVGDPACIRAEPKEALQGTSLCELSPRQERLGQSWTWWKRCQDI